MSNIRKKLPIGIQSFAKLRNGGFYYVDKTPLAWALAQEAGNYFLSRPRRFGKSLFLDTLKELFEGNQALFEGLYIFDKWDWQQKNPVIRISFGGGVVQNQQDLAQILHKQLEDHERKFNLPARYPDSRSRLADLIARVHVQSGSGVVLLIDEYDKPILDNLHDKPSSLALRETLKDFYSVIKDQDAQLRFVLLTGVSKFSKLSKMSLFSGVNNLEDITLDPFYSSICGYTEQDVEQVFAAELPGLDRTQMRRWYNGYNWLGEAVYNPFDVLLLFKRRVFKAWWFETGTPSFLVKLMAKEGFFTPDLCQLRTGEELISSFDVDQISPEALLFQAGYLTIIDQQTQPSGNIRYTLGYPNKEVEMSLNASLLGSYTDDVGKSYRQRAKLEEILLAEHAGGDFTALRELFQALFASIPHQWYDNNPISRYEGFYASVFYSYFAALGYEVRVEDATNHGRIDMSVIMPTQIYLFEFKVVEAQPAGQALQQLVDKNYAEKYRARGLALHLIGIEFSRETRNVVGFAVRSMV